MAFFILIFYSSQTLGQIGVQSTEKSFESSMNCGNGLAIESLLKDHPEFRKTFDEAMQKKTKSKSMQRSLTGSIVPVVFHIVQPCDGQYDFTTAELESALEEVNVDFANTDNSEYNCTIDPYHCGIRASDIGLTFKLATVDPDGNPTVGVTRSTSFYSYDGGVHQYDLKEVIQWNPSKYLNIWIVNKVYNGGASAYAQFPATAEMYPYLDGIVTDFIYLGSDNPHGTNPRPITLTHEIGHWLNLMHTWGPGNFWGNPSNCGDDDGVADTPNCAGIIHCPTTHNSCGSGSGDQPDNVHNFMDYSCQTMFTADQGTRMWDAINDGLADRDECVTDLNDVLVFQDNHPDAADAKLYTDRKVYTESFSTPGTVDEIGIITLEDCPGCSFSNNINNAFTVTGLPANIANGLTVTKQSATTAIVAFNINLSDPDAHALNVEYIFDIQFTPAAINGISNSNSVFNSNAVKGLKLDFVESVSDLHYTNIVSEAVINGDDYTVVFMPLLDQEIGFYIDDGVLRFYTFNSLTTEVAIDAGVNLVKRLEANETLASQSFVPLPGLGMEFSNDWAGNTGYVGIRITGICGEVFYVSVQLDFTGATPTIIDLVITTDTNLTTGTLPDCVPVPENSSFLFIDNVEIADIVNQSGNDGGYAFFTTPTTDLLEGETYDVLCEAGGAYDGEWRIYIDLNGNGSYLDPEDFRYQGFDLFNVDESIELIPAGTLNGQNQLATKMMILTSLYDFDLYGICNPEPYQYGEVEEYNVTIKSSACAPPETCIPMGCNQDYLFINQVELNDIDNLSGNNGGYAFFSTPTTTMEEGSTVNLQCTNGGWYMNNSYSHWNVYVDLNADGDYLDPSELRYIATDINDVNVNMELVPEGYLNGQSSMETTMMVVLSVHPIGDICQVFQYGEVEEYTITVTEACVTPSKSDITRSLWCNNKMFLKTTAYIGVLHQYRYRIHGTSNWTVMNPTTAQSQSMGILPQCTLYQIQLRVLCGPGEWSNWSGTRYYRTRPLRVAANNIYTAQGDWWAYLIMQNHTGDQKQFRFREVGGSWTYVPITTSHYVFLDNLVSDTDYQFQVRHRCGSSGYWSCFSQLFSFTTTSGGSMVVDDPPTQDLMTASRERVTSEVSVYPNPFQGDYVQVDMKGSGQKIRSLKLMNLQGQLIWSQEYDLLNSVKIPVQNLDAGVYILNINDEIAKRIVRSK